MNLLVDDTRLKPNEYREAFNVRNRFDVLDQVQAAKEVLSPAGIKQGLYSFGDYLILFSGGLAYWQRRDTTGWNQILGFAMDNAAKRVYTVVVPVNTTNYGRTAVETAPSSGDVSIGGGINLINVAGAFGNLPGMLVQDGKNQPQFIYFNPSDGTIQVRTTQKYSEWAYDSTGAADKREYVPIGTFMEWLDGVLYIVSADFNIIYRSVSGRPLDFVINVDLNGDKGGDASTTAYSVGVGGITCLKALNNGGLFVSAGNVSSFLVTVNRTPGARTVFGEYTFIRQNLFGAASISDKTFVDILGDSAFIDLEGLRSFNAVLQQQNEGRNSIFSLKVASLFKGLLQDPDNAATITFDNYALFAVNTVYGYAIIVYDTLSQCYSSIDTQLGGISIKQFSKIDTDVTQLYCIGGDDKVYKLFGDSSFIRSFVRTQSICSQNPSIEIKPLKLRCVINGFRSDTTISSAIFVNNRLSVPENEKGFRFKEFTSVYDGPRFKDVDSQLVNVLYSITNAAQGWKTFALINWTGGGSITNIYVELEEVTPLNPIPTQATETYVPIKPQAPEVINVGPLLSPHIDPPAIEPPDGGGPGPETPDLLDVFIWLKAEIGTWEFTTEYIPSNVDGQTVHKWDNQQGLADDFDGCDGCLYEASEANGYPAVSTDISIDSAASPHTLPSGSNPVSLIAVLKIESNLFSFADENLIITFFKGLDQYAIGAKLTTNEVEIYTNNVATLSGGTFPLDQYVVLTAIIDGANTRVRINAVEQVSGTFSLPSGWEFALFGRNNGPGGGRNFYTEIIVSIGAWSAVTVDYIEGVLATKYGITL